MSIVQRRGYEPIFVGVVFAMLFLIPPTSIGYTVDARQIHGVSVWLKPLKFELSIGIYFASLAVFTTYLDEKYRTLRTWKWMVWSSAISAFFEIGYIFFRASRGEASHFNESTTIAEVMYSLMGLGALIIIVATLMLGCLMLLSQNASVLSNLRLAIGLGLIATAILGGCTGIYIATGDSHWVGGLQNDTHGLHLLGWSRTGGDLRIAHIFGLHSMQVLPLLTLISKKLGLGTKKFIWTVLIIWSFLTSFLFFQAIQGVPLVAV